MEPNNLPQSAIARLNQAKQGASSADGRKFLFSGDFTARDLLLIKQAGFQPIGLVFGACVMQVGMNQLGYYQVGEVPTYSMAYQDAVGNAIMRLEQEAQILGADGVINIRSHISGFGEDSSGVFGSQGMIEVTFFGTAIRYNGDAQLKNARSAPFMTELNADGFCGLLRTGYIPTGLATGSTVYLSMAYSTGYGFQPFEEPNLTATLYRCRESCQSQAEQWARSHGSSGIVDFRIGLHMHPWESGNQGQGFFAVFALCLGTCVSQYNLPEATAFLAQGEKLVLPLNN